MSEFTIKKLYYSISEVSKITSLKPYVLRYWETEFPELKPAKNRAGNRIYRSVDINLILLIKKLLYTDKYTIEGARQKLKEIDFDKNDQLNLSFEQDAKKAIINGIRKDLNEILDLLNKQGEQIGA